MKSHSQVPGIQTSIYFREGRGHNSNHNRNIPGVTSLHNGIAAVSLVFGEKVFHLDKAQE